MRDTLRKRRLCRLRATTAAQGTRGTRQDGRQKAILPIPAKQGEGVYGETQGQLIIDN